MKTKLTKEQKEHFLKAYMENELSICLSYSIEDRIKYLGVTSDEAIEKILFDTVNESIIYAEDVIEGYDDMYIECLNPNIYEQEAIVIVDDSVEGEYSFIEVEKEELLRYMSEEDIEFTIRSWEYTFKEGYYHFGCFYPHNDEVKNIVKKIFEDRKNGVGDDFIKYDTLMKIKMF